MNKRWTIVGSLLLAFGLGAAAQDAYEDDIYFNPKKEKKEQAARKAKSNYIENFNDIDVDAYNMQGGFMMMPTDTIGARTENGEDFVYTQQIQKYYNPTIVIDNADLLADVLNNSYGNVDIVFNSNGLISFAPYSYSSWGWPYSYGWGYGWPYRYGWNSPYWGGWGWSVGFYDPWYAWGPSWGWGPGWGWGSSWGWGPGWGWGPSWGWGRPGYAYDYTPRGNRRVGAGGNWANSTRPGGNYAGNYGAHRGSYRAPSNSNAYNSAGGNHRVYNSGNTNGAMTSTNRRVNGNSGYTINGNGHRVGGSNGTTTNRTYNSTTNSNRRYESTTNSNRTYNYNRNTTTNSNRSYNYNTNRSTNYNRSYNQGGSYRSSGGGGSYSGGGGGGRGRHR